jgi:glycosyltransferase involved in cell wall biosynthesis
MQRCKRGNLGASAVAMLISCYDRLTRVPSRVDRFIAPSRFLAGKLVEGGIDPARIRVIPNFVDMESLETGREEDYYLYFGRLSYEKGIDLLIRAAGEVGEGNLKIVGDGPVRKELEDLAASLGNGSIEFLGFRSGDELKGLLRGAQFIVVPSRWYENLPFSVMEAMAAGKPVVASSVGGIPEMVLGGETGLLFPLGDKDLLASHLERLLTEPSLRKEMGARARERAEMLYGSENHYDQIMKLYEELL